MDLPWIPDGSPPLDIGDLPDLLPYDVDPPIDTGPPSPCAFQPDPLTVALYTFEGTTKTILDVAGQNPGQIHGNGVSRTAGKAGCGRALHIPQTDDHYVEIPHSNDWLLTDGSVDLWVRFDKLSGVQPSRGVISRDASGTEFPNHLTIYRTCDNSLVLRYQLSGDIHHYQCSAPVADETWHHVGVNFGSAGLALIVNGQAATRTDAIKRYNNGSCVDSTTDFCGNKTSDQGIAGNKNPWVLGSNATISDEGKATPVSAPLGGAIDSVRVSSSPRTF